MIAKICLLESNTDFDIEYTYIVPPALTQAVNVGVFVDVPFGMGNHLRPAVIVDVCREDGTATVRRDGKTIRLKEISAVSTKRRPVSENEVRLCRMMQRRYLCSFGSAMRCMMPPEEKAAREECFYRLAVSEARARELVSGNELRGIKQIRAIELLLGEKGGSLSREELIRTYDIPIATLHTLVKKEVLAEELCLQDPAKRRKQSDEEVPQTYPPKVLTEEQSAAFEQIKTLVKSGKPQAILLHGVTGSGKTEVYLHAIAEAVKYGGTAIMLVPEISLTPQTVARFKGRFGNVVAVFHSRLTPAQKRAEYDRVIRGEAKIAIGARSAVFAPLENLKLIILDEEQETSYKAFEETPHYHAGEIAGMRAELSGATVVFGSATPRVATYYRAQQGEMAYAYMGTRASAGNLPRVVIADMKDEVRNGNYGPVSSSLYSAMKRNYEAGLQTILFVPRRGYAGRMICAECGKTMMCGKCRVTMTYHKNAGRLICHYCGNTVLAPEKCPSCGSRRFIERSVGTEQLENELQRLFPGAETVRMDADTTAVRDGHRTLLERFGEKKCPFLVGTQMIAKGLDFPDVTLVGVVNADGMLNIPEYNAGERAFQLLTQVFGRAGRDGKESLGILQTMDEKEPVYQYAIRQDYTGFYEHEIEFRRHMGYPPFQVLCTVTVSGTNDKGTYTLTSGLREKLFCYAEHFCGSPQERKAEVLPVSRASMPKLEDRYRWTFLVKTAEIETMLAIMKFFISQAVPEIPNAIRKNYRIGFDIDE